MMQAMLADRFKLEFHRLTKTLPQYDLVIAKGGPKIEKTLTGTMFTGKKTVAMTLKKGTWKYYCSNHESEMFGFFKVTS